VNSSVTCEYGWYVWDVATVRDVSCGSDDGKNRNAEADDNDSGLRHAGDDPRIAAAPRFVDPLTDALAGENRPSHREAFVLTDAMPL